MQQDSYNNIEIRTTSAYNELISPRGGVGVQILIDGVVYTEGDDYYVDVDSFFAALSEPKAVITFVGGCHQPGCCANGAWSELAADAWLWNDSNIRLSWTDVHRVAEAMLKIVEEQNSKRVQVWCANPNQIDFYRFQLTYAQAWANL
jgi:hypothetical protein